MSALYRICSFIAMKCVYIVFFTVSSLVSISLNFIPLLRDVFMARSFAPVESGRFVPMDVSYPDDSYPKLR